MTSTAIELPKAEEWAQAKKAYFSTGENKPMEVLQEKIRYYQLCKIHQANNVLQRNKADFLTRTGKELSDTKKQELVQKILASPADEARKTTLTLYNLADIRFNKYKKESHKLLAAEYQKESVWLLDCTDPDFMSYVHEIMLKYEKSTA